NGTDCRRGLSGHTTKDTAMRRVSILLLALAGLGITHTDARAEAAKAASNSIGKQVATFTLPDFHGRDRSLADCTADKKVIVVAFLGNECPLAKLYAPRLVELNKEFAPQGVSFIAINSNSQDSITELANFVRQHAIDFPVLKDPGNAIADSFGALRTPEVF